MVKNKTSHKHTHKIKQSKNQKMPRTQRYLSNRNPSDSDEHDDKENEELQAKSMHLRKLEKSKKFTDRTNKIQNNYFLKNYNKENNSKEELSLGLNLANAYQNKCAIVYGPKIENGIVAKAKNIDLIENEKKIQEELAAKIIELERKIEGERRNKAKIQQTRQNKQSLSTKATIKKENTLEGRLHREKSKLNDILSKNTELRAEIQAMAAEKSRFQKKIDFAYNKFHEINKKRANVMEAGKVAYDIANETKSKIKDAWDKLRTESLQKQGEVLELEVQIRHLEKQNQFLATVRNQRSAYVFEQKKREQRQFEELDIQRTSLLADLEEAWQKIISYTNPVVAKRDSVTLSLSGKGSYTSIIKSSKDGESSARDTYITGNQTIRRDSEITMKSRKPSKIRFYPDYEAQIIEKFKTAEEMNMDLFNIINEQKEEIKILRENYSDYQKESDRIKCMSDEAKKAELDQLNKLESTLNHQNVEGESAIQNFGTYHDLLTKIAENISDLFEKLDCDVAKLNLPLITTSSIDKMLRKPEQIIKYLGLIENKINEMLYNNILKTNKHRNYGPNEIIPIDSNPNLLTDHVIQVFGNKKVEATSSDGNSNNKPKLIVKAASLVDISKRLKNNMKDLFNKNAENDYLYYVDPEFEKIQENCVYADISELERLAKNSISEKTVRMKNALAKHDGDTKSLRVSGIHAKHSKLRVSTYNQKKFLKPGTESTLKFEKSSPRGEF